MSNEWIEWHGGECPVEEGVIIDVRHRDGEVIEGTKRGGSGAIRWTHSDMRGDIIAYRLHQPEQEEAPMTIEQLLTKANKHATKAAKHERKRQALIEQARELLPDGWKLEEGESIYPELRASLEEALEIEMQDPANWKAGDVVECVKGNGDFMVGKTYKLTEWQGTGAAVDKYGDASAIDEAGDDYFAPSSCFKWISRPQ